MKERTDRFSPRQLGALITLLALAVWGLAVLWIHLVTPAGADMFEMTYVGTLTAIFLILLPLYWKQLRPAYIGGILIALALLAGAVKGAMDHSLVFSWSLYSVTPVLAASRRTGGRLRKRTLLG